MTQNRDRYICWETFFCELRVLSIFRFNYELNKKRNLIVYFYIRNHKTRICMSSSNFFLFQTINFAIHKSCTLKLSYWVRQWKKYIFTFHIREENKNFKLIFVEFQNKILSLFVFIKLSNKIDKVKIYKIEFSLW